MTSSNLARVVTAAFFLFVIGPSVKAEIRGVVMTTEGIPLPSATVHAYAPESNIDRAERLIAGTVREPLSSVETDRKGRFTLELDSKVPTVSMVVRKEGYVPSSTFAFNGSDAGAIPLAVDNPVTVRFRGSDLEGTRGVIEANGAEITRTIPAELSIEVPEAWIGQGTSLSLIRSGQIWTSTLRKDSVVNVPSLVEVSGRIVRSDGETPVADAVIAHGPISLAKTADDGSWTALVPADWKTLQVTSGNLTGSIRRGQTAASPSLISGGRMSLTLTSGPGGAPVAGAIVSLGLTSSDPTRISDSKGKVTFEALPPGSYQFRVHHPAYESVFDSTSLESGENSVSTIVLGRAAVLEGWVVDQAGRGVAAASVVAAREEAGPRRMMRLMAGGPASGWSDPEGRFVINTVSTGPKVMITGGKLGLPSATPAILALDPGETRRDLRITIPLGIEVTGRVIDQEGVPVAGVVIEAAPADNRIAGVRTIRRFAGGVATRESNLVTDADGAFSMQLAEGLWKLSFKADGFAGQETPIEIVPRVDPLEIRLVPGHTLRGRVVTQEGAGVADVRVLVPGADTGNVRTAPDGSFAVPDLPHGQTMLVALDPERSIREMRTVTLPSDELTIRLPATGTLAGKVVDEDGAPVKSFQAQAGRDETGGGQIQVRLSGAQNDSFITEDGRFTLDDVPIGTAKVTVSAPGFISRTVHGIEIEENEISEQVEIRLEKGATISGKVTGPDGMALSDVSVSADVPGSFNPFSTLIASTNASGEYELTNVPRGERTITFTRTGLQPTRRTVQIEDQSETVDARLEAGLELTGRVRTSDGRPVVGAQVHAVSSERTNTRFDITTDGAGNFSIDGLAPGRYTVRAMHRDHATATAELDMRSDQSIDLTMESGGTLVGRVSGLDESFYSKTSISARNSSIGNTTPLRMDGTFRLEGAPTGSVTVMAQVNDRMAQRYSEPVTVEVVNGGEQSVDLRFVEGLTISGTVTRRGNPLTSGVVVFRGRAGRNQGNSPIETGGKYRVSGLVEGTYDVSVFDMSSGAFNTTYEVTRDATFDIDIRGGSIEGRVVDSAGAPVENADVQIASEGSAPMSRQRKVTGVDGRFRFDDVTAGQWSVIARKDGFGQATATADVRTEAAQELVLRLAPAGDLILRVIDASSGQSVPGSVVLYDGSGREVHRARPPLREDGTLLIEAAPGSYTLWVTARGLERATRTVSIPGPPVTITLGTGGDLLVTSTRSEPVSVRMRDAAGRQVALAYPPQFTIRPGENRFDHLAPGDYTLEILDSAGTATESVPFTIRNGETTRVGI
ncbi:MAG: carboxypeptidase-like regulatory domain-containing protein [Acidobacteria bacterium]|nr:carboxypeptidase-like regulatory domain-containing protein [Acidobacteriota bacterium]